VRPVFVSPARRSPGTGGPAYTVFGARRTRCFFNSCVFFKIDHVQDAKLSHVGFFYVTLPSVLQSSERRRQAVRHRNPCRAALLNLQKTSFSVSPKFTLRGARYYSSRFFLQAFPSKCELSGINTLFSAGFA
jgi:hypothetical protein